MKTPSKEEIKRAALDSSGDYDYPMDMAGEKGFIKGAEWMEQHLEPLITELAMEKARKAHQSGDVMTLEAKASYYRFWRQRANGIIKNASDELKREDSTYTVWDDQHLKVQYMILQAMMDFADEYAKAKADQLQAELEQVKAEREWRPISEITERDILIIAFTGGLVKTLAHLDGRFYPGDNTEWVSPVTHWMKSPSAPKTLQSTKQ